MKLTLPQLKAMQSALNAALAGDGFDGGDFDGEDRAHYRGALEWVHTEIANRPPRIVTARSPSRINLRRRQDKEAGRY